MEPLLLTVPEAASRLGISRSAAYALIGQGRLKVVHLGRSVRVPASVVERFVAELIAAEPPAGADNGAAELQRNVLSAHVTLAAES